MGFVNVSYSILDWKGERGEGETNMSKEKTKLIELTDEDLLN